MSSLKADSTLLLSDILITLRRLETQIQGQNDRLSTIEFSFRSGTASSTSSAANTSISEHEDHHESTVADSPAAPYARSILKLKERFEFMDKSESIIDYYGEAAQGSAEYSKGNNAPQHRAVDDDAYSVSVYSSATNARAMSQLHLDIPPIPPLRLQKWFNAGEPVDHELAQQELPIALHTSENAHHGESCDSASVAATATTTTTTPAPSMTESSKRRMGVVIARFRHSTSDFLFIMGSKVQRNYRMEVLRMRRSCSSLTSHVRSLAGLTRTRFTARGYFIPA